jgi:transposase
MSGKSKSVSAALFQEAELALKALGKAGEVSRKLQAIMTAKRWGVSLAAQVFCTSRPSIMSWINKFKQDTQSGLELRSGRGRKPSMSAGAREDARKFMQKNPNTTINGLCQFIKEKHRISISASSANRLMKQLNLSYITPRPIHHKADIAAQEAFKKNSRPKPKSRRKK